MLKTFSSTNIKWLTTHLYSDLLPVSDELVGMLTSSIYTDVEKANKLREELMKEHNFLKYRIYLNFEKLTHILRKLKSITETNIHSYIEATRVNQYIKTESVSTVSMLIKDIKVLRANWLYPDGVVEGLVNVLTSVKSTLKQLKRLIKHDSNVRYNTKSKENTLFSTYLLEAIYKLSVIDDWNHNVKDHTAFVNKTYYPIINSVYKNLIKSREETFNVLKLERFISNILKQNNINGYDASNDVVELDLKIATQDNGFDTIFRATGYLHISDEGYKYIFYRKSCSVTHPLVKKYDSFMAYSATMMLDKILRLIKSGNPSDEYTLSIRNKDDTKYKQTIDIDYINLVYNYYAASGDKVIKNPSYQ